MDNILCAEQHERIYEGVFTCISFTDTDTHRYWHTDKYIDRHSREIPVPLTRLLTSTGHRMNCSVAPHQTLWLVPSRPCPSCVIPFAWLLVSPPPLSAASVDLSYFYAPEIRHYQQECDRIFWEQYEFIWSNMEERCHHWCSLDSRVGELSTRFRYFLLKYAIPLLYHLISFLLCCCFLLIISVYISAMNVLIQMTISLYSAHQLLLAIHLILFLGFIYFLSLVHFFCTRCKAICPLLRPFSRRSLLCGQLFFKALLLPVYNIRMRWGVERTQRRTSLM